MKKNIPVNPFLHSQRPLGKHIPFLEQSLGQDCFSQDSPLKPSKHRH